MRVPHAEAKVAAERIDESRSPGADSWRPRLHRFLRCLWSHAETQRHGEPQRRSSCLLARPRAYSRHLPGDSRSPCSTIRRGTMANGGAVVTVPKAVAEYPLPAAWQTHEVAYAGNDMLVVSQQTDSVLVQVAIDPATGRPLAA